MAKARKRGETGRQLAIIVTGKKYALLADQVLEVARVPVLTRVPNSPPALLGLMNFHGRAIPVIRLSKLLDATDAPPLTESRGAKLIVYGREPPVGLLIDDVLQLTDGQDIAANPLNVERLLTEAFVETAQAPRRFAEHIARGLRHETDAEEVRALLVFVIAGQRFALPLEGVAEVMKVPRNVSTLPGSEAVFVGMIELRDEVVPLVSLAALLGLTDDGDHILHAIVIAIGEARIALVVGAMHGVTRVPESAIEPVPRILQRGTGEAEIDCIARAGSGQQLISILSPSRLLRNRAVGEVLADRGVQEITMPTELRAETDHRFVVFRLGQDIFGLPIEAVDEIVRLPNAIARVPNAPTFVAGVINLRGKALPVIDQRVRFAAENSVSGKTPRVIVLTIEGMQAGFIVDAVSEIVSVPGSAIGPAPDLPGNGSQVFDRVAAKDGSGALILVVDPKELLDSAERDLLERFKPISGVAQSS